MVLYKKKSDYRNKNKEKWSNTLSPLKSSNKTFYDFVGFDVETKNENNEFLMGGLFYYKGKTEKKEVYKSFWNKEEMIKYLFDNKNIFENKYIVATNLEFDFTVLFNKTKYWNKFDLLYRGNQLVMVKEKSKHKHYNLKFIDTMNYIPFGVKKWGKILGIEKLGTPKSWEKNYFVKENINSDFKLKKDFDIKSCYEVIETLIPRTPINEDEIKELEEYNLVDCKISCEAMYLLQKGFNNLGGKLKITSASSSMDIFRRKYLKQDMVKETYILQDKNIKNLIFDSYYGGRTEVFKRGFYKNIYYYDINSLYPSVMLKELPLPQSVEKPIFYSVENIKKFMGVSKVKIKTPKNLKKPLLPFRHDGKLVFPLGVFTGTYTHLELEKAIRLGYEIISIEEQIIYKRTFIPFKKFVYDLKGLRDQQKSNNNPLEIVTKLVMNSLYGKFGMKKISKTKIIYLDENFNIDDYKDELIDKNFKMTNDYISFRTEEEYNGKTQFPIIASYITAMARMKMYKYLLSEEVIYTDTDSIITKNSLFIDSKKLGEMKLEGFFEEGYFYKPKFYMLKNNDYSEIKIKGVKRADEEDFNKIVLGAVVSKWTFIRLKQSIIQKKEVNELSIISKNLSLEDNKRNWNIEDISLNSDSYPLIIND